MQLSASSVPVVSAVKPPNDGMTLPPPAWMAAMSLPKLACEIGSLVLPSQYAVHDPGWSVWRKASDRKRAPDCPDSAASPVLVS